MLDLTDPSTATAWGLSAAQLRSDDLAPCQEVARAARRNGYEAIRYPAASGAGVNLAIFLDRLHAGSTVQVDSAAELTL